MFWDIQPNTVVIESILVGIEVLQTAPTARAVEILVHRGILLMTEDNALTRPAFPRALAALGALGLLLIALQLPTPARQTVAG